MRLFRRVPYLYRPGVFAVGLLALAGAGIALKAADDRGYINRLDDGAAVEVDTTAIVSDLTTAYRAGEAPLMRVWRSIETNPAPVIVALVTFFGTVLYHSAIRGKSLREAVETAATRVVVIPHTSSPVADEPAVIVRAKNKLLFDELTRESIAATMQIRHLTATGTGKDMGAIKRAEQDAAHSQQELANARRSLEAAQERHERNQQALATLNVARIKLQLEERERQAHLDRLRGGPAVESPAPLG